MLTESLHTAMYGLSDEQAMLRETVRDFVDEHVIPQRAELDAAGKYPQDLHDMLSELGILAMGIPEDCGGLGMASVECSLVYEELARGCTGTATAIGANSLGSDPILLFGTDEQKKHYLGKVAEGAIAAYGLTEPGAGTDVGGIKTLATPCEDGKSYRLKGQKTFITNAGVASIYTLFALTDPSRGPRGISCFIKEIDPASPPPGIEFPDKFDKMGINASETREIILDGLEVQAEDIVGGKPGRGFLQAMGVFDVSRPMIGSMGVGLAQSAFDEALLYSHQRSQFGKAIIEFDGLRQIFVDMWLRVEGARAMVQGGARKVDRKWHRGERIDVTAWSAMAKFMGSEASRITLDALQTTGGYGYINETPFPKMVRDHKVLEIYEGTNQIQREQAGRQFIQSFQKLGTALPEEAEESFARSHSSGGHSAAMAYRVIDRCLELVLSSSAAASEVHDRQDVHWLVGEMCGLAESARLLSEAAGKSGAQEGHFIHALGEAYAREACLGVVSRSERILRGGNSELYRPAAELHEEARGAANGLLGLRDRLGEALLQAHAH